MYFAKNLRFLRRKAEMTQATLGDKIATDYNTISRYESGKSTPKLEALSKLAQVFAVSIEELRNVDLTNPTNLGKVEEPGKRYSRRAQQPVTPLPRPAKHKITVAVELDGTLEAFERAVARLAAISDVVAATD